MVRKKMSREDAVNYLSSVDNRVHYIQTIDGGFYDGFQRHAYHEDQKISDDEIKQVLKIITDFRMPFVPFSTSFDIWFGVYDSDNKGFFQDAGDMRLVFNEKQLPEGYNFDKLSEIFLTDRNKELLKFFGLDKEHNIKKMKDRSNFTY
ncbi:MAG: hypothetical protein GOV02_02220 [Candidatus Aenigmarchaeota archaeon]|nr:hypothetical protein [Candidatus Aenigmarchaeota archaeon]